MKLYDYYVTGDDANDYAYNAGAPLIYYIGQTFTPAASFTLYRVKLKLARTANLTGNGRLVVANTSGGVPTTTLLSYDFPVAGLTTTVTGSWKTLDIGVAGLTAGTKYAIYLFPTTDADISHRLFWMCDGSLPSYAGGSFVSKAGARSWAADTDVDFMFELWGYVAATAELVSISTRKPLDVGIAPRKPLAVGISTQ
jgi:hypothetical protein